MSEQTADIPAARWAESLCEPSECFSHIQGSKSHQYSCRSFPESINRHPCKDMPWLLFLISFYVCKSVWSTYVTLLFRFSVMESNVSLSSVRGSLTLWCNTNRKTCIVKQPEANYQQTPPFFHSLHCVKVISLLHNLKKKPCESPGFSADIILFLCMWTIPTALRNMFALSLFVLYISMNKQVTGISDVIPEKQLWSRTGQGRCCSWALVT